MVNFKVVIPSIRAPFWRVASGGAGGAMLPDFRFCPPDLFLAAPTVFFWEKEIVVFWPEKTLKFVISVRKRLRISAKTFFFLRSPGFGRKICDFDQKKPSDFGEDLFFGDHLVLAGKKR